MKAEDILEEAAVRDALGGKDEDFIQNRSFLFRSEYSETYKSLKFNPKLAKAYLESIIEMGVTGRVETEKFGLDESETRYLEALLVLPCRTILDDIQSGVTQEYDCSCEDMCDYCADGACGCECCDEE
jgi:hypothetical protein